MSHIDSFTHEFVGQLGHVPVYHPLETINGDFNCTPHQLVLGGGSGEHPALVLEKPTHAVAVFLQKALAKNPKLKDWKSIIAPFLSTKPDALLTFYEWDRNTYQSFKAMCQSPVLPNPLYEEELEEWLVLGLGEFIFYAMPELAPKIMGAVNKPYTHFYHMEYNNILLVPPNVPVYSNGGNLFFKENN